MRHLSHWRGAARVAISAVVLAGVIVLSGGDEVLAAFRRFDPFWVAAALAITALQVVLSAWRWQFTAARLGVELRWRSALLEYYLATFLNQVLPGGVVGDAARAWRHGRGLAVPATAWRAVIIERASGQLVMAGIAALSLVAVMGWPSVPPLAAGVGAVSVLFAVLLVRRMSLSRGALGRGLRHFHADVQQSLLSPTALPVQLATSLAIVASYISVFLLGARGIGLETPISVVLPLVPLVLLAMLIPLSASGWGFREGAAAAVWPLAGLPAAEGVAASVAYGVLILLGSLPGAVVPLLRRRGGG